MRKTSATLPIRPLHRDSLASSVRDRLLDLILKGQFGPGERLVEMRLAEEMGTSQAPIREALRALEMLGIVESGKNRGTRVRIPDLRELREIYEVRGELEGYAAKIAAPRLSTRTDDLRKYVEQMRDFARRGNVHKFAEANAHFHQTIVAAADNQTLLEIWKRLDVKSRTTVNVMRAGQDLDAIALSHIPIIEAFASGKAAEARRAVQSHILSFAPSSNSDGQKS